MFRICTCQPAILEVRRDTATYLAEDQSIINPMIDFARCPPVVQFGVDGLLQQCTLEATGGKLSLDGGVDSVGSQRAVLNGWDSMS